MGTISTTITQEVTLAAAGTYSSPLTITNSGALEVNAAAAIYGPGTQAWTVYNAGRVTNGSTNGDGIALDDGGTVTNSAGGTITAFSGDGVIISGAVGTVTNAGYLEGLSYGVRLLAGGAVINQVGGTIGGTTSGFVGVMARYATATVTNAGMVRGLDTGIRLWNGGAVINQAGGTISGFNAAIDLRGTLGYVTNAGDIVATGGGAAINLYYGTVDNQAGGTIAGPNGVVAAPFGFHNPVGAVTVTNAGTVSGGYGVFLYAGGVVTNQSGGRIISTHYSGVHITGGDGTVTNACTIIGGTSGDAVQFVGSFTDRVVVDPGAVFTGNVVGGSGSNTLELAQGGGSSGTIGGIGTQFANFGTVMVDAGASWVFSGNDTIAASGGMEIGASATVSGMIAFGSGSGSGLKIDGASLSTDPSLAIGATLAGFTPGDSIDLTGIAYVGGTAVVNASNVLQVSEGGTTYDLQLDQPYTGHVFGLFNDGNNGTAIYEDNTPCFCRGTLILTPDGEVPVEALAMGDKVVTLSGAARPIKWIGRRAYDPRFVAGNRNVLPVRIETGALGPGIPARDLWVSPEHALYLRQVLVPAQLLVNEATIIQPESVERLEYFHIDLGTHDVILAEGVAAESYVDCDNRGMFHNAREFGRLYPGETPPRWEFYARRVEKGSPELAAIRRGMLARVSVFGRFSDDPDFHLAVDGAPIRPQLVANRRLYRFAVPAGGRSVVLASRSTVPRNVERSLTDGRRLGVAVERIVLRGDDLSVDIGPDCSALRNGFHDAEPGWRWTDGRGYLPAGLIASFGGAFIVEVHLAETEFVYGLETQAAVAGTVGRVSAA